MNSKVTQPKMETFDQAWAKMEAKGYRYGDDALENVKLGWSMAQERLDESQRRRVVEERERCADTVSVLFPMAARMIRTMPENNCGHCPGDKFSHLADCIAPDCLPSTLADPQQSSTGEKP